MHFGDNSGEKTMQYMHFRDNLSLSTGIIRVYRDISSL